jgi:ABC-2 type transport system permease protein
MIATIFWELRQRRLYTIGWGIAVSSIVLLLLVIYPSIHHQASQLNDVLNKLPASIRDLKTGGSTVDITTPAGYLNSQLYYATLPLFYIIMAIGLGSSLLARDEQSHTLELLLARPLSRGNILLAKALSGVIIIGIVSLIATLLTVGLAPLFDITVSIGDLLLVNLWCTLFSLSFGAVAFALTAASNATRRSSIAAATALSFGGYLLASLGGLTSYLKTPAKFLPYHFYNPTQILEGHVSMGLQLYVLGLLLGCIVISSIGFRRRDVY